MTEAKVISGNLRDLSSTLMKNLNKLRSTNEVGVWHAMVFTKNKRWQLILMTMILQLLHQHPALAQSTGDRRNQAMQRYKSGSYAEAAAIYEPLLKSGKLKHKDLETATDCFIHNHQLDNAADALDKLLEGDKDDLEHLLRYAKTLQHQRRFTEAALAYKHYFKAQKKKDATRTLTEQEIIRCLNGARLRRLPVNAIVEPLGKEVNTPREELAPVPSRNFSGKYYFSAQRQKGSHDLSIFTVEDNNGTWSPVMPLGKPFDATGDKIIMDIINNGSGIVFEQKMGSQRKMLSAVYSQEFSEEALTMDLPLDLTMGDKDPCFYQDSVMMFASTRPGGYGGYDLYLSVNRNGKWMRPVNLGPSVNSPFNEVNPSFAKDGQTIFFSSDNLESVGGYDIFRMRYRPEAGKWGERENMGLAINSAGDDLHFRMDRSGLSGVFSSNRWDKSMGGSDVFIAYFKDEQEEQAYNEAGTAIAMLMSGGATTTVTTRPVLKSVATDSQIYFKIDWTPSLEDDFISREETQKNIEGIARICQKYKDIRLICTGHATGSSNALANLFISVKKAGEMMSALNAAGIEASRIVVTGVGDQWPLSPVHSSGRAINTLSAWNNRVEVVLSLPSQKKWSVEYVEPRIPPALRTSSVNAFSASMQGLQYALLLGESAQMLNRELPDAGDKHYFVEYRNGKYYYYLGTFDSFAQVLEFVKNKKLPDNQPVRAFYSGEYIDTDKLIDFATDYPDLILLIDHIKKTR